MFNGLGQDASAAAPDATAVAPDATSSTLSSEVDGFLASTPTPTAADVAGFLKLYGAGDDRVAAAQGLLSRGVDPSAVSAACRFLDACGFASRPIFKIASLVSALACGYHGVRRNNGSIGWGLWWSFAGGMFPILVPVLALGQGFGRPKAG